MTGIKESNCDVLVVGAGPAGLMLATQLAQLGVNARIIDKMPHRVLRGHADGVHPRTSEVLDAMGLYNVLRDEGYFGKQGCVWDVSGEEPRAVQKLSYSMDQYSHMSANMLGQEAIERNFITEMEKHGVKVERLLAPKEMEVDEGKEYPVTVTLQPVPPPEGYDVTNGLYRSNVRVDDGYAVRPDGEPCEVVHCKYLVGCDGAHSWVRKSLGLEMEGERSSSFWGAFDAVVDSELTTLGGINIFKRGEASILALGREQGLSRIYVPLGTSEGGFDKSAITFEQIAATATDWLKPLRFELPYVDWWTCYEVAQRCTATMEAHGGRVLIAGDACHTHSPKAGQGMNVSMLDGFNLGWKLAGALKGTHAPEIVRTYSAERLEVAHTLIEFDRRWSAYFTGKKKATPQELEKAFMGTVRQMSGTAVVYHPSITVAAPEDSCPDAAKGLTPGGHFESSVVVQSFSCMPFQLQKRLVPDGRWKVVLFPGDVREEAVTTDLAGYAEKLVNVVQKFTKPNDDLDTVIEVITVFKSPHDDVQERTNSFAEVLRPRRTIHGVKRCYPARDTLYADAKAEAYKKYGVEKSAAILVRPDQYVAGVFELRSGDLNQMDSFLSRVLVAADAVNGN